MDSTAHTYVQLCGHLVVDLRGRRIEQRLPSRQGRAVFAYLVLQRPRAVGRDELIEAIWAGAAPKDHAMALTVLLSKLRAAVGADVSSDEGAFGSSCRRTRASMSSRHSPPCTAPSPRWSSRIGRGLGALR